MPEVNYPMRSAAQEPGTKHYISVTFQDRFKKDGILVGVILEVRVLNNDQITRSCMETHSQCCSFPEIAFLQHEFVDPPGRLFSEELSRSIGRSVVHNDDFHISDRSGANCFNYSVNRRSFIITRDNDG